MNETLPDIASLVPIEEKTPSESVDGSAPVDVQQSVIPPVDIASLSPVHPEEQQQATQARLAANPSSYDPQRLPPMDSGFNMSPAVPLEEQKKNHLEFLSKATGFSKEQIEPFYEPVKFLMNLSTSGAVQGVENLSAATPLPSATTVENIMDTVMTPMVVAAAISSPEVTIPSLLVYSAFDHVIPKMQVKGATPDQQATINLVRMLALGLGSGGVVHGVEGVIKSPEFKIAGLLQDKNFRTAAENYIKQRAEEVGAPDVVTVPAEAHETLAQIDAANKIARKNDVRRQVTVDQIAGRLANNEDISDINASEGIIRDAKQQVIDEINAKQQETGKIRNRDQQIRFTLTQELKQGIDPNTVMGTLGVDQATVETAKANNLEIPVKGEKLVNVALDSPDNFEKVVSAVRGEKKAVSTEPSAPLVTEPGTGDTVSGVAKEISEEAVKNGLLKNGVSEEDLAKYEKGNKKSESKAIADLMNTDIERAKRLATGKELPREGDPRPESLFKIMRDYATDTKDGKLSLELAQSPEASRISTAGSVLSMSDMGDPDSAPAKIGEVIKNKEKIVERKLKKTTPEKVKAKIKTELKTAVDKAKPNKYDLMNLLDKIKC